MRVTTVTKHEEGCGPRRAARIEARECARTSQFVYVAEVDRRPLSAPQKLFHRSTKPGRPRGRRRVNGSLVQGVEASLTREKSRAEAEPRAKKASRGASRCVAQSHPKVVTQARAVATGAQEVSLLEEKSRHAGQRHLGGTRVLPTRNGPCRWKASAVRRSSLCHRGAVKLTLAAPPGRTHAKA